MMSCFSTKFQEKAEEYYDDSRYPDVITYTTLVKVSKATCGSLYTSNLNAICLTLWLPTS